MLTTQFTPLISELPLVFANDCNVSHLASDFVQYRSSKGLSESVRTELSHSALQLLNLSAGLHVNVLRTNVRNCSSLRKILFFMPPPREIRAVSSPRYRLVATWQVETFCHLPNSEISPTRLFISTASGVSVQCTIMYM